MNDHHSPMPSSAEAPPASGVASHAGAVSRAAGAGTGGTSLRSDGGASLRGKATRAPRAHAQFMPTLFDRLRDEAPAQTQETAADYTISPAQVRDIVLRDLSLLLNTTSAEGLIDRQRFSQAAASSINFGVPALTGHYLSEHRWALVERLIRRAIADYEPRLIPESVSVRPLMTEGAHAQFNVLLFEIRAAVALTPYPLEITVQSAVDLETNRVSLTRASRTSRRTLR